ncbi:hypothetical protein [Christiangramia sp. SM2212]|uniref:Uncharacterized protein n=1 Tax=Christiangramia sediminicola TaxID=3073267 RepID=A0ABU1ESQ0_9FLAO|nr:hypothetical protein [Christiangramia sp. SM2212]MDR5591434.1 hypothetical protein [Christiangramia sp. SM2212]
MKIKKHTFLGLLLLQLFLLSSTTSVFAFSEPALDLDSRKGEYFKAEHNKQALLIEENLAEVIFQNLPELENDFFQLYPGERFLNISSNDLSGSLFYEGFQPDHRSILKSRIFPFHTFW